MKLSRLYQKYIYGSDLASREHIVTIASIDQVEVQPRPTEPPQKKWCLVVKGLSDPELDGLGILMGPKLVESLIQILGNIDHESVKGKQIVVYPREMTVAGQKRVAIRFKAASKRDNGKQPAPPQKAAPPPPDDEIPF